MTERGGAAERALLGSLRESGLGLRQAASYGPHHNVYVVLLDREVHEHKRFRDANPDHDPVKPCVYVGMTGKAPSARGWRSRLAVSSTEERAGVARRDAGPPVGT